MTRFDPKVADLLRKIPLPDDPPLPRGWLRCEMLERFRVIEHAGIGKGDRILEVGAGGHAIATVPLAYTVGADGWVVAAERARWTLFREVVEAAELRHQVRPVACNGRRLPFSSDGFDTAACIHGIRSMRSQAAMVEIFREMLRVAPRLFLAESMPVARTNAQRAHLAMYDLREEIFEAVSGARDDLHYLPIEQVAQLVEQAGGSVVEARFVEVDLPHALAYLPREYVQRIPDLRRRQDLLDRWDEADALRRRYGTDHPPVGTIVAHRRDLSGSFR